MTQRQAPWLVVLACMIALSAGCSTYSEPRSGSDTRSEQERERSNEPRGGGGGY